MFKKFYIFGLLFLGISFISAGVFLNNFQNRKSAESGKSVLNSSASQTASIAAQKQNTIAKEEVAPFDRQVVIKKVLDGDTVETDKGETIRYIGINSPEVKQPFYREALELNQNLVLNKNVRLEFDVETKDRYGRTLAYVFINNIFINLEMIKKGVAVSQTIQPDVKYQDKLIQAQKEARSSCLGLWESLCSNTSSCIKIVSINADAVGNDNTNKNGEWVELQNTCQDSVNINGWLLKDSSSSNKYLFKDFILEKEKSVFLYSGCGKDSNDKLYWQCPEGKYAVWNNAGDLAFLYNDKGELVSDYSY